MIEGSGAFHGAGPTDLVRTEVYLKTLEKMGYHAIALGGDAFNFGTDFIRNQIKSLNIPFLSANVHKGEAKELPGRPYLIKELGPVKVGILALTAPPLSRNQIQAEGVEISDPLAGIKKYLPVIKREANLVVVLSDLSEEENRSIISEFGDVQVILAARGKIPVENVNHAVIVSPDQKYLARLDLWVDHNGRLLRHDFKWIYLSLDIAPDPAIEQFISRAYGAAVKDRAGQAEARRRFSDQALEQDRDNGYVGAESCRNCHAPEYRAWKDTSHSRAFDTLRDIRRHFYPDCISCHTTGFGYPTGFQIGQTTGRLAGVECEVCHGPGRKHTFHPETSQLRRTVPASICLACHDKERNPDFEGQKELFFNRISHKALTR
ncbi:MAG: multiheme c-type cytochrome [Thermodesulfobacteriota bacterium]|nr:multiheme c-type cytochrome [Thermodesulfobacteriota bacterium]